MATTGHITQHAVSALKPNGKTQWLWEKTARGSLGIKMTATGKLFAAFQYGAPPNQKRESLGQLSAEFTLYDARKQAQKMGDALYLGGDASAAGRQARQERFTVADLVGRYLDSMAFKAKASKTRDVDRGRIDDHILPLVGHLLCSALTPDQCHRFFVDVSEGKTACDVVLGPRRRRIVKGGHGVARKCIMLIRAMWSWGARERLLSGDDPTANIDLGADGRRRIAWSPEDYRAILAAVTYLEGELEIRSNQADAVRVILWTGARFGEIAAAKWEHYQPDRCRLVLSEHKTAKKTQQARIISLPAEAIEIIEQQDKSSGYIFAGRNGFPVNLKKAVPKIRARPGVPADFILHGLRHSLASAMARAGLPATDIMFQLGHSKIQTSQGYIEAQGEQRAVIANRASVALFEPLDKAAPALYVVPKA